VFDWMHRKSEPWSLATLKLPWVRRNPCAKSSSKTLALPCPKKAQAPALGGLRARSTALWVTMPDAVMGRKT
jgi:hypothetical protein